MTKKLMIAMLNTLKDDVFYYYDFEDDDYMVIYATLNDVSFDNEDLTYRKYYDAKGVAAFESVLKNFGKMQGGNYCFEDFRVQMHYASSEY